MKKLLCFLLLLAVIILFAPKVFAVENPTEAEEIYEIQAQESGAEELPDALDPETQEILEGLRISPTDLDGLRTVSPGKVFEEIARIAKEKAKGPVGAAASVLAVMLLCSMLNGIKLSFGGRPMEEVAGMVGTLCVCGAVTVPVVECIGRAAGVIEGAAGFQMVCAPVLAGLMAASGQVVSAGTYNILMAAAGNAVSLISAVILVPLLNIFLALSIVSAVSPEINLSGLCGLFSKAVKWILGLCMAVFTGLLTVQSAVSAAADSAGTKAAKFLISSFVPLVGGALGDAMGTVQGSVKLLKSGVGAFGLIAGAFLFLPVILECLLWMLSLALCAGIGDVLGLPGISGLLRSSGKVVETMMAIVLCCMTALMISTVVVLAMGGNGG